jgi:hypothetical protein
MCNLGYGDCNGNASDGCETNLGTSVTDCGSCHSPCTLGPTVVHASPACAGSCSFACDTGYGNCDSNTTNGCETDLHTLTDCGGCHVPCALGPTAVHATSVSCDGTCHAVCDVGFADCDGNAGNGCEQAGACT